MIREIKFDDIVKSVKNMIIHAGYNLPKDALEAL